MPPRSGEREEVGEGVTSEAELEQIINNAALASSAGKLRYEDYNAVMAVLLISSALTLLGMLISDLSYALVDPRITFE